MSGYQGSDMEYRRRVMELAVTFPINQVGSAEGNVCESERVHKTAGSLTNFVLCLYSATSAPFSYVFPSLANRGYNVRCK